MTREWNHCRTDRSLAAVGGVWLALLVTGCGEQRSAAPDGKAVESGRRSPAAIEEASEPPGSPDEPLATDAPPPASAPAPAPAAEPPAMEAWSAAPAPKTARSSPPPPLAPESAEPPAPRPDGFAPDALAETRSLETRSLGSRSFESPADAAEPADAAAPAAPATAAAAGPAGAYREADGYVVVPVFYGTDRAADAVPMSAYQVAGERRLAIGGAAFVAVALLLAAVMFWWRRPLAGACSLVGAIAWIAVLGAAWSRGGVTVVKQGVTYTGERGEFVRGRAEVTIPDAHERGELEAPQLWKLEVREDARRHVVLRATSELLPQAFARQLASAVARSPERDLLVFVHGYNVGFEDAVRRTAQIAYDLPFEGVPVCYSWPSQGGLMGYTIDENNVAWSTPHLRDFLREIAAVSGAKSINLVAHSMGNRALTEALKEISYEWHEDAEPFDRVVLAAPDVDADRFRRELAPRLLDVAHSVTLYASSSDLALQASKRVHGYPRAGESGPSIVVVDGVETIDVSGIDLSLLGHGYYAASHPMLRDLFALIREARPARERDGLRLVESGAKAYWQLAGAMADAGEAVRR